MKTKIKAVLFDIDDTLYDREKAQFMVLDKIITLLPDVFSGHSKKRIIDAFLESDRISTIDWEAGLHVDDIRDYRSHLFLEALGISPEHAGSITDIYLREYPNLDAPVDGAVELVQKANLRFKTGVISNSMPDVQYRKIETLGLRKYFSCVVLATEVGMKKPDSEIFYYASSELGIVPSECLYIGDNYENDIEGAKKAGMKTCWFSRDENRKINPIHADYVVKSLTEAARIIEQLQ